MEYIVIVVGVIALLIAKGIYDSYNEKKKLHFRLLNSFGTVSDQEYSEEKLKSLKSYYEAVKDTFDIDEITWNDLELEELYMVLNNTVSAVGEEYLYAMLRKQLQFYMVFLHDQLNLDN